MYSCMRQQSLRFVGFYLTRRFVMVFNTISWWTLSSVSLIYSTSFISTLRLYSGPSSYDRLDIRTTWVTTKILVLTYDHHVGQGHLIVSYSLSPEIHVFVYVIPVSAVLYIINFANYYQNGPKKAGK
jgi:hypothetical protein